MLAKTAKPNYTIITVESFKFMETPFLDCYIFIALLEHNFVVHFCE